MKTTVASQLMSKSIGFDANKTSDYDNENYQTIRKTMQRRIAKISQICRHRLPRRNNKIFYEWNYFCNAYFALVTWHFDCAVDIIS
ncbi:hypothetical protein T12_13435 [Trichinella patagoniensis]|uniref:PiggyBac transposable element-derived protein domain-containing protein n=1 Tax=Trichinella patagoniensis TaxID=990121 RepID=A0A0V1AGR9_9BILA|nr:hypothetical protein T12_13435 [Trichinella patagoniensis]